MDRLSRILGDRIIGMQAQSIAQDLMGDRVFANMLLVGAAWQQGGVPLSHEALMRAIELNGVAVEKNKRAFELGRLTATEPDTIDRLTKKDTTVVLSDRRDESLDEIVTHRMTLLTDYQNRRFARRYEAMITRVKGSDLSQQAQIAVAKSYYKLLAVKDEWEVARLYAHPDFQAGLKDAFDGDLKLTFHVGAWPFGSNDKVTGKPRKGSVGGWMLRVFRVMAPLRILRGTVIDPFRNTDEAKLARKVLADYEADITFALTQSATAPQIAELLNLPEFIRGYGHVRERHVAEVDVKRRELRAALSATQEEAA
jgi:indolepyruvate ferredoxin oxidoreductase